MIEAHLEGLLTWTSLRVSNGALEGMNNRIKLVSHRAFGFRRPTTYITAIWHSCGALPLN
jgi:transposase